MKAVEIKIGKHYRAKVSNNLVTVRVDGVRKHTTRKWSIKRLGWQDRETHVYDVTNLKTNRQLVFRSSAKFRFEVQAPGTSNEPISV